MDIVIDIQGFRDADSKFIPKEVAVVAINRNITDHWILMPPYLFSELSETSRKENNWLTRYYHGIEWNDGESNPKYLAIHLREITRSCRRIYVRGSEKARYLQNLLSRNIYNLESISPSFKCLTAKERCTYHGLRERFNNFQCALTNAYKLKQWLNEQNSIKQNRGDIFVRRFPDSEVIWSEDEEKEQNESDCDSFVDCLTGDGMANKLSDNFAKDIEIPTLTVEKATQTENGAKINTDFEQYLIPENYTLPPPHTRDEYASYLTSSATTKCKSCGGLSCRQIAEGVDTVDSDRC